MINEKSFLFNPFKIVQATEQEIINTYSNIQSSIIVDPEAPVEISNNIIRYADMNYLLGEMIARYKEECTRLKNKVNVDKGKYMYMQRKQWQETNSGKPPAMDFFEAMALEYVSKQLDELAAVESNLSRFKNAFDSITEKQNALKKKMEAIRNEI